MKDTIHPAYYDAAKITCSCGNVVQVGSTQEKLKTELCSNCHPFYTGLQRIVDTAGMVDKFKARRKAAEDLQLAQQEHEVAKKMAKEQPYTPSVRKTKAVVVEEAVEAPAKTKKKTPVAKKVSKKT